MLSNVTSVSLEKNGKLYECVLLPAMIYEADSCALEAAGTNECFRVKRRTKKVHEYGNA